MATRTPQAEAGAQAEEAEVAATSRAKSPRASAGAGEVDGGEGAARPKSLTIGAVCKALAQEFPDISISKIRYLEDQKL